MPRLPENIAGVLSKYNAGPTELRSILDGIGPADFNRRLPNEDWAIRDCVLHVADAELIYATRFRLVIASMESLPELPIFDPENWKRRLLYPYRDPEGALSLFNLIRYSNGDMLKECELVAWTRTGKDSSNKTSSLSDILEDATKHCVEHINQIKTLREKCASE